MKMRDLFRRLSAGALALLLCVGLTLPALADDGVIRISTPQDLLDLAEHCALDTWSQGKTVVLTSDLSLASVAFRSIPSFGGTFDGGGHTISGLALSSKLSPAGLFGVVQEGAVIRDLKVSGTVSPTGSGSSAGGIAGENRGLISRCSFSGTVAGEHRVGGIAGLNALSGQIEGCTAFGSIAGLSMTGGIVGENRGLVSGCDNHSYVNLTGRDPGLDLSTLELSAKLLTLRTLEAANISTDTGGVAGLSTGMLLRCTNEGIVGCQHLGYNVGGIVGRTSGFVSGCTNLGQVLGRKDVGGIAGQAEPYVVLELSQDTLETLRSQLHRLEELVDRTALDAQAISLDVSGAFENINDCLDLTQGHAQTLTDQLLGYGGDMVSEVDRTTAVVSDALGQLSQIAADASGIPDKAISAVSQLEEAVRALADAGEDTDAAIDALLSAANSLEEASLLLERSTEVLDLGFKLLANAQDADAVWKALEQILAGTSELSKALGKLSQAAGDLSTALDSRDLREAAAACRQLSQIFDRQVQPALDHVIQGLQTLHTEGTLDLTSARNGLSQIRGALRDLEELPTLLTKTIRSLKDALTAAKGVSGQLQTSLDAMAEAAGTLGELCGDAKVSLDALRELVDFLAGVDPIQIARPDDVLGGTSNDLFDSLTLLGSYLDQLNALGSSSAGQLTNDLRAINSQFGVIMDTLLDTASDIQDFRDKDLISDTSEEDVNAVTNGKLRGCTNQGTVTGDLCVGGIAGSMAVEVELDPEDDVLGSTSPLNRRAYELKAILQSCVNRGAVLCRRSYAGGICGRLSLGLATQCQSYGAVESENGDHVGGISGFATGSVRGCWAKCTLSGGSYVGGIVGAAALEGDSDGGVVTDCLSYVRIPHCDQFSGAVSGVDRGSFKDNRFVSDDLAGLGNVSLSGQAQPISYSDMLQLEGLPFPFRELTLRFLSEGKVLKTVPFHYGDSFDASVYPPLPQKSGCYAKWDTEELTDLRFDTDVTALFAPHLTSLASRETRSDGRSVLLAEGRFGGEDVLTLRSAAEPFTPQSGVTTLRRTVERWQLSLPEDGLSSHTLRYLSPSGSPSRLEVYALTQGQWQLLETEAVGSYLLFDLSGSEPVFAVVGCTPTRWIWGLAAAIAVAVIAAAVLVIRTLVLRRRAKAGPADLPAPSKPARKRLRVLAGVGVLLVCLAGCGAWLVLSGVLDGLTAAHVLVSYAKQSASSMDLAVQAVVEDKTLSAATALRRVPLEGKEVTCARQFGTTVYYCDGKVFLPDGRALSLGEASFPDYPALLDTAKVLYRSGKISVFKNDSEKIYSITVSGDGAQDLLRGLFPGVAELAAMERLDVELSARSGQLSQLRFSTDGVLVNGKQGSLSARLTAIREDAQEDIPAPVREAILSGGGELTDDDELVKLLHAWVERNLTDPLSAQLSLSADCGPLLLEDRLELFRTWHEGRQITCVQKGGRTLYFTPKAVYDDAGLPVSPEGSDALAAQAELLELAYRICLRGQYTCTRDGERTLFTLSLTPEDRQAVLEAILPDAGELDVTYTGGTLDLTVGPEGLESLKLSSAGSVKLLSAEAPMKASCSVEFAPGAFTLPAEVARAAARS